MRKLRMKVRAVKPRIKIIEPGQKKRPISLHVNEPTSPVPSSMLEAKTSTSALPLLKQEKGAKQSPAQARAGNRGAQPKKDDERIFVSYDRFSMSEAEKRKVYSLDIRGAAPSKQTATIERTQTNPLFEPNQNEIRPMERRGEGRVVGGQEPSLTEDEERAKYTEAPTAKYKTRRQTDFY